MLKFLARFDLVPRQVIYAFLFLAAGFPFLVPVRLPLHIWKETQSAFDITDKRSPNKVVAICANWDAGSQGENWAQYEAVVAHCMLNHIPFIVFCVDGDPICTQLAETVDERQAKLYGCVYGRDWVNLGLTRGAPLTFGTIGRNVKGVFQTDYRHISTQDFKKLPIMKNVNSVADFSSFWVIAYEPDRNWLVYLDPTARIPILFGSAGIASTGFYPYISSGQLKGMLVGTRGAAEYEDLLRTKFGKRFNDTEMRGQKLLVPLAFGHLVIIFFIVAGNLGMIAKRRIAANEKADRSSQ